MLGNPSLAINEQGHLTIGGMDTVALAQEFGTPLYVMDEAAIRGNCRLFTSSIREHYKEGLVTYASKALSCKELCRIMKEEGMGLDVVSGGELYTARSVDFPAERIFFHGNNKTEEELRYALMENVGRIVADNRYELETLNRLAGEMGKTVAVLLRIKPGIDAHTHNFIRTGQIDSKFGFALHNGEAWDAVVACSSYSNLALKGLHCHIGSQIFDRAPFVAAAEVMIRFYAKIYSELGLTLSDLNLGGGFGIRYVEQDDPIGYDRFMGEVSNAVHALCQEYGLPVPRMLIEPGRSIVGPAGITLYHIGAVKEIAGIRNYVTVDGGMTDNPRYALYSADYTAVVANKADAPADYRATIAGKCCESGDLLQENTAIAKPEAGDILAILATGAYNYSMASNYNRIPRPAMVMVRDGQARLIVRRESYEDLIRNDL